MIDSLEPSSAMMSHRFILSSVNLKMFNEATTDALLLHYAIGLHKKFVLANVTPSFKLRHSRSILSHWQKQHYLGRGKMPTRQESSDRTLHRIGALTLMHLYTNNYPKQQRNKPHLFFQPLAKKLSGSAWLE